MDNSKSFDQFYQEILPTLNELEERRAKGYQKIKNRYRLTLILFVICLVCVYNSLTISFLGLSLVFTIVVFISATQLVLEQKRALMPDFKTKIIHKLLDYFYEDVTYIGNQRMSIKLLEKSLLFTKRIFKNGGSDFTECKMGNTYVTFSEVQLYHKDPNVYFFNGLFISVLFNKSFKTKTIVYPKSLSTTLQRHKLSLSEKMVSPTFVKLEDPIFSNQFTVIGEDQVESRYILSTSFMQRLIDYKARVNAKVSYSFIDEHLYVAIPTKMDLFEPRVSKPLNDKEFIMASYNYFETLTGLVEDLDLNKHIWL